MIFSLLLLVGVVVAVPVPEFKDALGPDINVADPKWILQLYNALGKRQVEDGWLEDLIAVVELSGPIDSGIRPTRLEPVKSRRTLPPLLAALDPEVLLKYLDKRQTEDNILEDIAVALISTGLFPLGGKREIEDGLWDNIVNALVSVYETATDPEVMLLSTAYNPIGKRQIEDNLWDDIVNGVESAYEWLTSPEVLSVVSAGAYPIGKRQSKRLLGTATENPIDLETILKLINAVGKRQIEDNLWDDIVSVVTTAVDYLSSPEFALATTSYPVGKRQVEDGLWEDIVNAVVKASEALIENSGPALGKRQA